MARSPSAARPRSSGASCAPTWTSGRSSSRRAAPSSSNSGTEPYLVRAPSPNSAGGGVVLDAALEIGDRLGDGEGEEEDDHHERPELFHQEVVGVDLEELADADDGDEQLSDDHAFHAADGAEAHAGEDLGES